MVSAVRNHALGAILGLLALQVDRVAAATLDDALAVLDADVAARIVLHRVLEAPVPPGNDTTSPSPPPGFDAQPHGCGEVQLAWQPAVDQGGSGLAGYEIRRDGYLLWSLPAPERDVSDTSIAPRSRYRYEIAAVDHAGNRSLRRLLEATIPPCVDDAGLPRVLGSATANSDFVARNISIDAERGLAVLAGTGTESWLEVVDVLDPEAPRMLGFLGSPVGNGLDVARSGSLAVTLVYTADADGVELIVVDLALPEAPVVVGRLALAGRFGGGAIDIARSVAYVAGSDAGLQLVDISDPANPALFATVSAVQMAVDVESDGEMAYLLSRREFGVVDVSDPIRPEQVQRSSIINGTDLTLAGDFLYIAAGGSVLSYDRRVPSAPRYLDFEFLGAHAVTPVGDMLYATLRETVGETGRIRVIDATDPAALELVDEIETPGQVGAIVAADGLLYVGDLDSLLDVIDPGE